MLVSMIFLLLLCYIIGIFLIMFGSSPTEVDGCGCNEVYLCHTISIQNKYVINLIKPDFRLLEENSCFLPFTSLSFSPSSFSCLLVAH